jgi:photosystem II stability/assembly factor-like uncharacterized protein
VNRYSVPVAAIAACTVAALVMSLMPIGRGPRAGDSDAASFGAEPDGAWELMQLRDPATGRIPDGIRAAELAFASSLPTREAVPMLSKRGEALAYEWMQRGPVNIGGRTRALALDVTGEDTMLAAGVSGGLWRSTDAGATWRRMTLPTQLPSISAIAQDVRPGHTATWYYGTGELLGNSASGGRAFYNGDGIFKSTDNGMTWAPLASTISGTPHLFDKIFDNTWRLAVDASDTAHDVVYAALYGTIARTSDGGRSWRQVLGGPSQAGSYSGYYTDVAVTSRGVAYATISSDGWRKGIWRTTNGSSWTQITPASMPATYNRIVMGIVPQNENEVYFLAETPGSGVLGRNFRGDSSWQHLWRYTYVSGDGSDTGGRWEDLTDRLPLLGAPHGDFFTQGSYDMLIEVDPFDSSRVVIGGTNLYRTVDAFATGDARWIGGYHNTSFDSTVIVDLEYPNHHPDLHRAIFSRSHPGRLYTGSDGGVHRSDDAGADSVSWTSLNNAYLTTQFYSVAITPTPGDVTVVGGLQDNGTHMTRSADPALPWTNVGSGDGGYAAFAADGRSLYVSKQLGKIYRVVLDDAGNAVASTRVDPLGVRDYLFIDPFTLDPADTRVMYLAAGHEIRRNDDLAAIPMASTQPATTGWSGIASTTLPDSIVITALAASSSAPLHRLYYGTSAGAVYRLDDATSAAAAPTEITGAGFPANGYVGCIAVDPLDAAHVFVVFSNYSVQSLFESADAGASWRAIGGNLEANANGTGAGPSCRWLSILHRPNETVYLVGTSTGLYSTTYLDGMSTRWYQEAPSTIGNAIVPMIAVRQSDGFVAIATHGAGVWSTTIDLAGVDEPIARVSALGLSIVPNPATPDASIRFSLPPTATAGAGAVRVRLFDARGALIGLPFEGTLGAGEHRIPIGGSLPRSGGTYFCRIEAAGLVETRSFAVAGQ